MYVGVAALMGVCELLALAQLRSGCFACLLDRLRVDALADEGFGSTEGSNLTNLFLILEGL